MNVSLRTCRLAMAVPLLLLLLALGGPARAAAPSYTLFESGPVRPIALSPSGRTLFVCNIPDARLEVFRVTRKGLVHTGAIPVGLEPVSVAARSDEEAWVVNHLSDSVSIVSLRSRRVVQTLLVGDEPRDIVFGGKHRERAFITTAHRGQNVPYDPALTTPGQGRADVWVFDAGDPGADTLAGEPLTILTLFTDTPRALAVSPDGARVYAAGFLSGNRTTAIIEDVVSDHGGTSPPLTNHAGQAQPKTGLIVKFDGRSWVDDIGRKWDQQVKFALPDRDVFVIDARADPPVALPGDKGAYAGVGTVIFNLAVNPRSGRIYASNTDARNHVRFEGPGTFAGRTVRGHTHESRITVLGGRPRVRPIHLNKHIDYARCCAPIPSPENGRSVGIPLQMEVSGDGETLYLASFGTGEVAVYDTRALESDTFVPDQAAQISVSGGGPAGLALDEKHGRLYVFTRFDNAVSVIDLETRAETAHLPMFNPEPPSVVAGRRLFYDTSFTSSHGDTACASCHVFGDFDGLGWDLGVPDEDLVRNGGVFTLAPEQFGQSRDFAPLKGPMTTQSLRGLANHGAMHWRGDRQNNREPSRQPDDGAFDEEDAFRAFNPAFPSLNGRHAPLSDRDMQAFTDFVLQITYPPNPIRALDDSLTPEQKVGRDLYFNEERRTDTFFSCNGCHVLDATANAGSTARPGFFGGDGRFSFENESQIFKIPHLRNMYQKVGMFGMARSRLFLPESFDPQVDNAFMGDQVRGFGFLHDGTTDTLFRFHSGVVFAVRPAGPPGSGDPGNPGGIPLTPEGLAERKALEAFMLVFDSNLKPVVGQQVTLSGANHGSAKARLALLVSRADRGECELVARGIGARGLLYQGGGSFRLDVEGAPPVDLRALELAAHFPGVALTFTCVPPGSGVRLALDRDGDGLLDGDE
jgi:DNA-binding beta-propeller fold protein YncE